MTIVLVGLVAVGWWLGSMFRGLGPGGQGAGMGNGEGTQWTGSAGQTPPEVVPPDSAASANSNTSTTVDPARPESGDGLVAARVVAILIGENVYGICDAEDMSAQHRSVSLEEALDAARRSTGDRQGVRVRIQRSKQANAGTRSDLLMGLEKLGIPKEAIIEETGYVD